MSGHSKWSTIKRQKGLNDQKRGQVFTKMAKAITIAVKQGGGIADVNSNFRLRLAIDLARSVNMPKENIERAINRASGAQAGDLSEVLYEGFGPSGIAVMIEAATDNPQRTTSQVKSVFHKYGGTFGQPGSVSYQFKQVGRVIVKKDKKTFDEIFSLAVDSGAEDIEDAGDEVFIYTASSNLSNIKEVFTQNGIEVLEVDQVREPIVKVDLSNDLELKKLDDFIGALEELDDVLKVYTNT